MDTSFFENFLAGLSRITPLRLEVWDAGGVVFSPSGFHEGRPGREIFLEFYSRVSGAGAHQYQGERNRWNLYGVPLKIEGEQVGVLMAYSAWGESPCQPQPAGLPEPSGGEDVIFFLVHLAGMIEERWSSRRESEEMAYELSRHFEDIHLYANLATRIKTLRISPVMLGGLIEEMLETLRVDLAFSLMPDRPAFNQYYLKNPIRELVPDPQLMIDQLVGAVDLKEHSLAEKYFVVNDSRESACFRGLHRQPFRFLAVMIQHEDVYYGWIGMVSFNLQEYFRRSELRLLISVAEQIAMVITNTELYLDQERFVINMVKSLVFAIEAKDRYTRGHSERVNRFSLLMAEHLGLGEEEKRNLNWASVLHDIGKIGIPEAILNKPGRLTGEEYDIIKKHPLKGAEILKPIEQLKPALPGVIHHHEHYNGNGYPMGLKGEAIPLIARIIAVADTFDAITSSRAYRPGMSYEKGLAILREEAGRQLDPDIVTLFHQVFREGLRPSMAEGEHASL